MIRNKACVHAYPYEKEIASDVFSVAQLSEISLYKNLHSPKCNPQTRVPKKQKKGKPRIKTSKANLKVIMNDKTPATSDTTTGEVEKPLYTFDCKLDTIAKSPT